MAHKILTFRLMTDSKDDRPRDALAIVPTGGQGAGVAWFVPIPPHPPASMFTASGQGLELDEVIGQYEGFVEQLKILRAELQR